MARVVWMNKNCKATREYEVTLDSDEKIEVIGAVGMLCGASNSIYAEKICDGEIVIVLDPDNASVPGYLYILGRRRDGKYEYLTDVPRGYFQESARRPEADREIASRIFIACRSWLELQTK